MADHYYDPQDPYATLTYLDGASDQDLSRWFSMLPDQVGGDFIRTCAARRRAMTPTAHLNFIGLASSQGQSAPGH